MTLALTADDTITDVVFDIAGTTLPAEHAQALAEAICARLAWSPAPDELGIHPLRANATDYGVVLLAQRAKLVLRVRSGRLPDALRLAGQALDVAGSRIAIGAGHERPLRAAATLSAHAVTFGANAGAFDEAVAAALAALGVSGQYISGRRRAARIGERTISGFSLTLHGLCASDSITVQAAGLGEARALGWGLFIPAKAITCA